MADRVILIYHPVAATAQALAHALEELEARVLALSDPERLPTELRHYGPDVLVLGRGSSQPVEPFLRLVREDAPRSRVVVVGGGGAPVAQAFATVGDATPAAVAAAARAALAASAPPGAVLVVEDALVNLEMIADILHARGYRVMRAASAEEGVQLADSAPPDLVLLDIYLPGMSGLDALRVLKSNRHTAHVPVIMRSADGTDAAIAEALDHGAIDFVVKPFSPRLLAEKVAVVMARTGTLALV
jgi:CheY-like chemotaxis protein